MILLITNAASFIIVIMTVVNTSLRVPLYSVICTIEIIANRTYLYIYVDSLTNRLELRYL